MRQFLYFPLLSAALFASAPAQALTYGPALLTLQIDDAISAPVEIAISDNGLFRGELDFLFCDGSVLPSDAQSCDGSVTPAPTANGATPAPTSAQVTFSGSVFPFIAASLAFLDAGTPSSIILTVTVPVPLIAGSALAQLDGSLTLPANRESPGSVLPVPGYAAFLIGSTGPDAGSLADVLSAGPGPVAQPTLAPETTAFGPETTAVNCTALGGCSLMVFTLNMQGLGGGQLSVLEGRFDVDAVSGQVPLPASALLLAGALAGVGAMRRRRQR